MNRRGVETSEAILWIFRLIAALVLLGLLIAQIVMITGYQKRPYHMELALYQARLVSGPHGIFLQEGSSVVPGIVDSALVTTKHLTDAYSKEGSIYGCRMRLFLNATSLKEEKPFRIAYNNEELVLAYLGLGAAGLSGPGGAAYERHVYPVTVKLDKMLLPGFLEVEVVKRT